MRDRIGAVGGRFEIASRPGQEAHVRRAIPDGAPVPASIELEDAL